MVELWNSTCGLAGLPKVLKLTKQRNDNIYRRINEYGHDPMSWEGLFQRIVQTPFLMGENDRGWMVNADFVFCNDTNITRILEGRYDQSPNKKDTSLTACFRGVYAGMAEIERREKLAEQEVFFE